MENLQREAVRGEAHLVGDVMADVSLAFREIAEERSGAIEEHGLEPGSYLVVTAHRAGTVDDPRRLRRRPAPPLPARRAARGPARARDPAAPPSHPRAARGGGPHRAARGGS